MADSLSISPSSSLLGHHFSFVSPILLQTSKITSSLVAIESCSLSTSVCLTRILYLFKNYQLVYMYLFSSRTSHAMLIIVPTLSPKHFTNARFLTVDDEAYRHATSDRVPPRTMEITKSQLKHTAGAYITCRLGMYTYQFIYVFVLVERPSIK